MAPENLAALRSFADAQLRRGVPSEALRLYRRARQLAPNDPELERLTEDLEASARSHAAQQARQRSLRILQKLERWLAAIDAARA